MTRRLGYIDGIRAIAVLAVALFHARVHVLGLGLEWWAKECSHGVDLFFVVSGFCLAYPTLDKLHAGAPVRFDAIAYALKRFLRIVPPYVLALALLATFAAIASARGLALPEGLHAVAPYDILNNVLFLDQSRAYVNNSFWTLAVEFRWYFVFPFALWLAAKNMRGFLGATLLIALAGELTRAGSVDVQVLSAFLLGIAAAWIRIHDHPIARYAPLLAFPGLGFAVLDEMAPHFPIQASLGWHIEAFLFVVAAGASVTAERILSWKPLAFVGVTSYSIYLIHEPIVSALAVGLRPALGDTGAAACAVAAGVVAGFVLWYACERPLTRPETVAAFVTRCRPHMMRLFAIAGVAISYDVIAPDPITVSARRQDLTASALELNAYESAVAHNSR